MAPYRRLGGRVRDLVDVGGRICDVRPDARTPAPPEPERDAPPSASPAGECDNLVGTPRKQTGRRGTFPGAEAVIAPRFAAESRRFDGFRKRHAETEP